MACYPHVASYLCFGVSRWNVQWAFTSSSVSFTLFGNHHLWSLVVKLLRWDLTRIRGALRSLCPSVCARGAIVESDHPIREDYKVHQRLQDR